MKPGSDGATPTAVDLTGRLEATRLRQALYRFFGALLLPPTAERLAWLRQAAGELLKLEGLWGEQPYASALRPLLGRVAGLEGGMAGELERAFNRLFEVNPLAPPYESVHLDRDGEGRGALAAEVQVAYARSGLQTNPAVNELPDHVAVELEFLSYLCGCEADALEGRDLTAAAHGRREQRVFMDEHLARWFPAFARAVVERAEGGFYPAVVGAAFAFLKQELALLGLRSD